MKSPPTPTLSLLLRILDEGFDRKAWHGPNLKAAVHGVSLEEALWRPQLAASSRLGRPKRHCIAEIALHAAYWKYSVRRRLTGEDRGTFPVKGSNWFPVPTDMNAKTWRDWTALLRAQHAELRAAVAAFDSRRLGSNLDSTPPGSRTTFANLIYGAALHDVYHAGQIRQLKAMYKGKNG